MVKSPTSAYYSPETRIVLITPPPVNTKQWVMPDSPRVFETTKSYAEAVKEVGEKEDVPVADIWTPIFDGAGRSEEGCEKYLSDGLHLNGDGYKVRANWFLIWRDCSPPSKFVFQAIIDIVERVYPELDAEGVKLQNVFVPCVLLECVFGRDADAICLQLGPSEPPEPKTISGETERTTLDDRW
jgi:hypothetical protein